MLNCCPFVFSIWLWRVLIGWFASEETVTHIGGQLREAHWSKHTPEHRATHLSYYIPSQSTLAKANARHQTREIPFTLNQVRFLAVYICASHQRQDAFNKLLIATNAQKLTPIRDVEARWNSTFLMFRRAKRLLSFFTLFCEECDSK